jgi:predicted nucleic acid-binding protein
VTSAIVDTGILYAMADRDDAWHERVKAFFKVGADLLIVPVTVIPEACYLMNTYVGRDTERRFVLSLLQGEMRVENLTIEDLKRASRLLEQYQDANIGFVDATVVAVAERLRIRRLLTTDRRHFTLIRPRHCPAFHLLP